MSSNFLKYQTTENDDVLLYKDIFVIFKDIIGKQLEQRQLSKDIVKLMDGEFINVNRAPLIILKRTHSPQPPTIALLNQGITKIDDKEFFTNKAHYNVYLSITCYGNTYIESERLGSIVQEAILASSMQKIKAKSKDKFIGHELLNWTETVLVSQDTKLFQNQTDIRLTILFDTLSEI